MKADPNSLSLQSGSTRILLTSGLTVMFKGLVLWETWGKAKKSAKGRDYSEAIQKTVDFSGDAASLASEVLKQLDKAKGAASKLGKAGGVLGVLSDGIDTGIFVYYDMLEEGGIKDRKIKYEDAYNTRCAFYNGFIAAGKVTSTVGSAFMCSVVGAPIGLIIKAIGLGISNLSELIKAIDGIGEEEKKLFKNIWNKMTVTRKKEFEGLLNYYISMNNKFRHGKPHWNIINTQIAALEKGFGDEWVGIGEKKVKEIRQVFNIVNQKSLRA